MLYGRIPNISVIMPVYNGELFVREALNSILSQTFTDFEFIIIDDGSTDNTESIIKSYADSRIKFIKNLKNLGIVKSLNLGLDSATGKYIARMDADDISLPQRLEKQFDFMESNPDIDVCGTWYELFESKSGVVKPPEKDRDIKGTLFFNNCIAHPTVIIRKNRFPEQEVYHNQYINAEDYELWCREIDRLKFANIPEVLLKYRVHEKQTGIAKIKEQDSIADLVRIRNLQKIGIVLTEAESKIYFDVIGSIYEFKSLQQMEEFCKVLNKIGTSGKKKFGVKFQDIIRNYLRNIAEKGMKDKKTSLELFFTIFWKWTVFPTARNKARYIYHAARNLLG